MVELLDELLQLFVRQADSAYDVGVLPNDSGKRFSAWTGGHKAFHFGQIGRTLPAFVPTDKSKVSKKGQVSRQHSSDTGSVGYRCQITGAKVILATIRIPPIQKIFHNGSYFSDSRGFQCASSGFSDEKRPVGYCQLGGACYTKHLLLAD